MVQVQEGFPFSVESVSSDRVQLWARYAAHVSTGDEVNVVIRVYGAFWHDMASVYCFEQAVLCASKGRFGSVLGWLDLLLVSLTTAGDDCHWSGVVECLVSLMDRGQSVSLREWYEDACSRVQMLVALCHQVVQFVADLCQEYQCALPERTRAFFEECSRG